MARTLLPTKRLVALAIVLAVLAISGVAYGLTKAGGGGDGPAAAASTSTTDDDDTTTSERPTTSSSTTTTAPETTTTTGPDGVLEQGERGEEVAVLQRRLAELRFDPGPADGRFGLATHYAVQGFQKLAGLAPDGKVGPAVQEALASPPTPSPLQPTGEPDRLEVDLQRQLLFLYDDNALRLISHVSTGSGEEYCAEGECGNRAITPVGPHRFTWRYKGWRESRLGKLYNPVYFTGSGVAVHGSTSVPTYPASHGCVRIPMHIAEYFPSLVRSGDAVYVIDGGPVAEPPARNQPAPPPPADPPTSPDSTTTTTTTTTPPPPAPDGTTTTTASTTPPGEAEGNTTTTTTWILG
ncbi:MAG TPA: L,D-transpeptidase family protein [Acidimicrobiales bacterium]|nr:L,D-transpeptidase family protein [Acidimicrobiales bacterium]